MDSKRWFLALSFALLSTVPANAQILKGVMVVSQD